MSAVVVGQFECQSEECEEGDSDRLEPIPPLWMDYWPRCTCGAEMHLSERYVKLSG